MTDGSVRAGGNIIRTGAGAGACVYALVPAGLTRFVALALRPAP